MCRPIRSHNRHRRAELWARCKPHLFILARSRNVSFYFLICYCMHMHYLCVYVWWGRWRPQVNVKCLLSLISTFFLETKSLSEPGAQQFRQAGWLVSPGILLSLSPRCWGSKHLSPCLAFCVGPWHLSSGPQHIQQSLYWRDHLLGSQYSLSFKRELKKKKYKKIQTLI